MHGGSGLDPERMTRAQMPRPGERITMTMDRAERILGHLARRLPRESKEPASKYILRLGEEIKRLDKLIYVLQQDLSNVAEISRRSGLRTSERPQP